MRPRAQDIECPSCGAAVGELCRRLTAGRYKHVDGFHKLRKDRSVNPSSPSVDGADVDAPAPAPRMVTITDDEMVGLIEASGRLQGRFLECRWGSLRIPATPGNRWALELVLKWRQEAAGATEPTSTHRGKP